MGSRPFTLEERGISRWVSTEVCRTSETGYRISRHNAYVDQLAESSDLESECWGFESLHTYHKTMNLYTLHYGKSKRKMKPIMVDSLKKCQNYKDARSHMKGFHKIEKGGEKVWRQKSCTVGGNRDEVPKINRRGQTSVNGWVGKGGFNPHT
jgi:hypothetical protein